VTEPRKPESLVTAHEAALGELGAADPNLLVVEVTDEPVPGPFGRHFPERYLRVSPTEPGWLSNAAGRAGPERVVFARASSAASASGSYGAIRDSICGPGANVKIVGTHGGVPSERDPGGRAIVEDLGVLRGLPGMTVVVPADAPSARAATRAIAEFAGPAYLRLTRAELPTVTDGSFEVGRASTLRDGADLTIVAVGALVARALEVADELGRVGVSARVLDFASLKPFDEKALLRAARETGAILTLEEHSVATGLGSLVASATSEEAPVPVRRVGLPDVFGAPEGGGPALDRYGLSRERCLEEAWSLLRGRGKVQ
jgi:transketolase